MSVFDQRQPSRIRVDTASALAVDVIVPCFIVLYPATDGSGKIQFAAVYENPAQFAALTAALIRQATAVGVMNVVMQSLTSTPTEITAQIFEPKPPGTPPDDLPAHLRNKR